ncbi:MAG: chromosome segregation protein SMC, partial [Thermoplasmata archaeon]
GELREAMESLDEELKDMPEPEEDLLASDLRTLKRERTRVENRMYELEPVDMTAIEEFERESSRLSDLREKMEKLREEVRSIDSLVRELNRRKKEAFMEVFNRVNEHFRRIFAELAMGEGELLLENRDDPFSGGMTILVRPKGKKAVRLEALSGGEKSLTALAFIFALQQYQPSPVYVLDEVDMFLDAVNAEAIGRKIREFSRSAQFIVVTLRRATLRHADRIVGVTMDQKGVSRVFTQEVPGAGG